jgi:hypothetical protein
VTCFYLKTYIVAVLATLLSSCHGPPDRRMRSFSAADPAASKQLVVGFYPSENGYRWTGPTFTVALPADNPAHSAEVTLSLFLPPNEIEQLGPVTITATGSEYQFGRATYDQAGAHDFTVQIPQGALSCTNVLPVTFTLDKYMHPSNGDSRELGVVVNRISLRN